MFSRGSLGDSNVENPKRMMLPIPDKYAGVNGTRDVFCNINCYGGKFPVLSLTLQTEKGKYIAEITSTNESEWFQSHRMANAPLPPNCAFVNVEELKGKIEQVIQNSQLGIPCDIKGNPTPDQPITSGHYVLYRFNSNMLKQLDPKGYEAYRTKYMNAQKARSVVSERFDFIDEDEEDNSWTPFDLANVLDFEKYLFGDTDSF